MKRNVIPWLIAAALAIALVFVLAGRRTSTGNEIDGVTQDGSGRRVTAWIDPMYSQGPPHNYKSNHPGIAPDCNMRLVPVYADTAVPSSSAANPPGHATIAIPPAGQQRAGVRIATAETRNLARTLRTTGRVTIDERRFAQVHARFEGFVEALYVNVTGQPVRRGDPLVALYSPDLLATENELILAERNRSDLGRSLAAAARARLRLFGLANADIDRVARSGQPLRDVVIHAPVSGVVTTRNVVAGARVTPADTLYEIADLSHVWIVADVYEPELATIHVGTPARISVGGRALAGRVTFIAPVISPQTRTASVRIECDNAAMLLKPDMFADVVLEQAGGASVAVPDSAVMNTGTRTLVFIARADGTFEPREVVTGEKAGGFYAIRSGLQPGERVAIDANFLLDSESRLKSKVFGEGR